MLYVSNKRLCLRGGAVRNLHLERDLRNAGSCLVGSVCSSESCYKNAWTPPESRPLLATPKRTQWRHSFAALTVTMGNSTRAQTWREGNPLRLAVGASRGISQRPCTPAKARTLFKQGKAKPGWNRFALLTVPQHDGWGTRLCEECR